MYSSRANPTCFEALMAKQSPRGQAGTYKTQVVHSHVSVASDSPVHVSSSNKGCVKPNLNPVGGANASRTNIKQVIGSNTHVKQMPSASHANVNPNCDKTNRLQGSGDIVSPTDQMVTWVKNLDQIRVGQTSDVSDPIAEVISATGVEDKTDQVCEDQNMAAKVMSAPEAQGKFHADNTTNCKLKKGEQSVEMVQSGLLPLYDVNVTGVEGKLVNSILHMHQFSTSGDIGKVDSEIYNSWCCQSDFNFGFMPLSDQMLPNNFTVNEAKGKSHFEIHEIIRSTSKQNFMQARIQIKSQLNIEAWKKYLEGYWDRQLCELIQFGSPLDFPLEILYSES